MYEAYWTALNLDKIKRKEGRLNIGQERRKAIMKDPEREPVEVKNMIL